MLPLRQVEAGCPKTCGQSCGVSKPILLVPNNDKKGSGSCSGRTGWPAVMIARSAVQVSRD